MPGSFPVFDAVVAQLISRVAPRRALDVGTGAGKYGHLLARHAPDCQRTGIEVEASHVPQFGLIGLYDPLLVEDVTQWWRRTPGENFDLVVIGECVEHLPKSAALDLLNALVYRCAWLVLLAPEFVVQPATGGVASQAHLSVWSERDLHWHDLWAWDNCRAITFAVLRGYQPSTLTLQQLVDELNTAHLPLQHFDGQTFVRPARLRLVEHRREVDYRPLSAPPRPGCTQPALCRGPAKWPSNLCLRARPPCPSFPPCRPRRSQRAGTPRRCPAPPPPRRAQTIFVSVASYCDPLLGFTLRSAYAQASDPSRLYFGVVEQAVPEQRLQLGADWAHRQVRWLRLHALEARGPCWARALGMSLYQGEDWYFQIDSHTWFEPGWDDRLLAQGRRCAAINPRCLVSCYPNPFRMEAGEPYATVVGPQVLAHVLSEASHFAADHPVLFFEGVPVASDQPVPGFHVGAGCLLAPGRVVDELPYDPQLYFHGEEQAFALRAWTRGWDIFHAPGMPIYHLYHQAGAAPRPLHWSPALDAQRAVRSAALGDAANRRLADLLWHGADLGAYGLGTQRSLADYADFSGIDYAARRIAPMARKARFGF